MGTTPANLALNPRVCPTTRQTLPLHLDLKRLGKLLGCRLSAGIYTVASVSQGCEEVINYLFHGHLMVKYNKKTNQLE